MIYTGSKALQFLSIPVYTIFKNLTIILIAYGEVLWFGGSVTNLTLFSFGLMVFSSVIAAWADIKHAVESNGDATSKVSTLNAGYIWMLINCLCTSSYVLGMRKRIKLTNFKDFDSECVFGDFRFDHSNLSPIQPCSTTTSFRFLFSSSVPVSWKIGHLRMSPRISPLLTATALCLP